MTNLGTLSVNDIVNELGVHPRTVLRWIDAGELKAFKESNARGYRIEFSDYEEFLKSHAKYYGVHIDSSKWKARRDICQELLIGLYEIQKRFLAEDHGPVYSEGWNNAITQFDKLIKESLVDVA